VSLLIAIGDRDTDTLVAAIRAHEEDLDVRVWPELGKPDDIEFAVLWKHPPDLLERLPSLQAVTSYGAGVEHLLNDPALPDQLPVGRLTGPLLASHMAAFLLARVIGHWKGLDRYPKLQREHRWAPWSPVDKPQIGLLGLGRMGSAVARAFQALDFSISGFCRSGEGPTGVKTFSSRQGLLALAAQSDYLICLLPLTDETRGILDAGLFAVMKPGAVLINVGRGDHLVEDDLIPALDAGRPGEVMLDVFSTEPLPHDHPFWDDERIHITPHCASLTSDEEAAGLIVSSYRRVLAGQPPLGVVDRNLGY
jgi:glyoxylate/hydroxypyruvate reductase